jgi:hypothetical protein
MKFLADAARLSTQIENVLKVDMLSTPVHGSTEVMQVYMRM